MTTTPFRKVFEPTGIYAVCRLCGENKDTSEFPADKKYKTGHSTRCRACSRQLMSESRKSGKQTTNNRKRDIIREAKSQPCADCGVAYPYYVMDLDHLPGHEKSFQLGKYMQHTLAAIVDELKKCEAVCANCHRIRTHTRLGLVKEEI